MSDNKKTILNLLADGKITADEAEKLLGKITPCCEQCGCEDCECENAKQSKPANSKFLRIKVQEGDETTVNINLPLVLAEVGLKLIPKKQLTILQDYDIDIDSILQLIQGNMEDATIDINTENDGKPVIVKVYID